MTRAQAVYIDMDSSAQWFIFRPPYHEKFTSLLKARIPNTYRFWDKELKAWGIARTRWFIVEELLDTYFDDVWRQYSTEADSARIELLLDKTIRSSTKDYATLGLRADASTIVVHAAYRAIEAARNAPESSLVEESLPHLNHARNAYERICEARRVQAHAPAVSRSDMIVRAIIANTEKTIVDRKKRREEAERQTRQDFREKQRQESIPYLDMAQLFDGTVYDANT